MSHLLELVDEADKNHDGKIDLPEWELMGQIPFYPCFVCTDRLAVKSIKRMMPMSEMHLDRVRRGVLDRREAIY